MRGFSDDAGAAVALNDEHHGGRGGGDPLDPEVAVLGAPGVVELELEALRLTLGVDPRLGPVGDLVDGSLEARSGRLEVALDGGGVVMS